MSIGSILALTSNIGNLCHLFFSFIGLAMELINFIDLFKKPVLRFIDFIYYLSIFFFTDFYSFYYFLLSAAAEFDLFFFWFLKVEI